MLSPLILQKLRQFDTPTICNLIELFDVRPHMAGYNHIPQIHVPVRVGGLTVFTDDLLHADRNGVTTTPVEIAGEVADIGAEFVAAETIVLDAMRKGAPTPAILAAARAEMAAQVQQLTRRVSRSDKGRHNG